MSTVDEIEAAISNLSPKDFARVRNWLLQRDNLLWDLQIEEDAISGKLDSLVREIENDIGNGMTKPLNEVIDGL
jgi:hypothetical protein